MQAERGELVRYLIGIVLGFLIVFNWSTIKSYFDKQINEQAGGTSVTNSTNGHVQSFKSGQAETPNPAKNDLFKEFK